MDYYTPIEKVVKAEEVLSRWNITAHELDQIVRNRNLAPYYFKDIRRNLKGEYNYCECFRGTPQLPQYADVFDYHPKYGQYYIDKIVFSELDVVAYEFKHPELMDKVVVHEEVCEETKEWISGSDLQALLKLSPGQFVEFVHGNNLVAYWEDFDFGKASLYEYNTEDGRIFNLNAICDSKFHIADLRAKALKLPQLAAVLPGESSPRPQVGADPHIAELDRQLAEVRQENEALAAEVDRLKAETSPSLPKTAKATEAAQAGRVQDWKKYARVIARVAYECGREDRTDVPRSTFKIMAQKHGNLSNEALEVLREALPEVAKTTAGAPKQG